MHTIGVLALQGDFREHVRAVEALGARAQPVRLREQLRGLDGLILPGGESTSMRRLLRAHDLVEPLANRLREGLPTFGTCAGCILLAHEVDGTDNPDLGLMDIGVSRNAYGRQIDSFETDLAVPALVGGPVHAIFIRAPRIAWLGSAVEPLARMADGNVVAARQGSLLVATFHPELTGDGRFHRYFLERIVAPHTAHMAVR